MKSRKAVRYHEREATSYRIYASNPVPSRLVLDFVKSLLPKFAILNIHPE